MDKKSTDVPSLIELVDFVSKSGNKKSKKFVFKEFEDFVLLGEK